MPVKKRFPPSKIFQNVPAILARVQIDYDLDVAEDQLSDRLDNEIREYQPTA